MNNLAIQPGVTYDEFTFMSDIDENYVDWDIYWSIEELSGDLVAGLLVGINLLIDDIIPNGEDTLRENIIRIDYGNSVIGHNLHEKGIENILRNYIAENVQYNEIVNKTVDLPITNDFLWWLPNLVDNTFILYKFQTPEFIQGFISTCNGFNVDFRDYILGPPFKVNDQGQEIYYDIQGYDITHVPVNI